MRSVDLATQKPSMDRLVEMSRRDPIVIKCKDGRRLLLTEADEFASEVELLRRNHRFLAFLDKRAKERGAIPIEEVARRLRKRSAAKRP